MKYLLHIIFLLFLTGILSLLNAQNSTLNNLQKDSILKEELQQSKKQLLVLLLQNQQNIEINNQFGNQNYNYGKPVSITLSGTGLVFYCTANSVAEIIFNTITDYKFSIYTITNSIQSGMSVTECKLKIGTTILSVRESELKGLKAITKQFKHIQKLQNDLFFKMNAFEQMAAIHRSFLNKPYITEDIRKYIVQAESYAKLYNYEKAIELNYQLIATHPTAYPNVYYNIAILLAETNSIHSAIYNMKKYLLLETDTNALQSGKSKIDVWEIMLNN